ncbi:PKD domain-containing protein [Methanocalculus taiwanensis]|nr:PKD domain-containing protein [Methanocalculus taiwanensis]
MKSALGDKAVSPVVSAILIIFMVVALGVIVYSLIYGIPGELKKSAFIAAEAKIETINESEFISLYHKSGDTVALNGSGAERSPQVDVTLSLSGGKQIRSQPDDPIIWGPGQTLYIYTTPTGPMITTNRILAETSLGFGGQTIDLVIIDTDAEVLVFGKTIAGGGWKPDPSEVPAANFSANTTSGYPPLTVQFFDQSTGLPTIWSWNFGDGNISAIENPIHTYGSIGSFTVTLTASNPNGSGIVTKEHYIIVISPIDPLPVADFVANTTEGVIPLTVQFTDTSAGDPDAWDWNFGDGTTSVEQHPTHTYTTAGYYNVTLMATNVAGNNSITKSNFIHAKGFVDYVIEEGVFVYGNVLNFQGGNVNGPDATVVVTGGMSTDETNLGATINVTTIYIDGNVNLLSGSAGLGSATNPGDIYVNGNLRFGNGGRNIYGDVYVNGNFDLKDARIHGNVYVDGDLTLDWTPWLADDARIYYTGSFTHPPTMSTDILDKCIHQPTVPGFDMPGQEIPPVKSVDWYAARGYVSGGTLTSNMKVFADSYSFEPTGSMNAQNVIIIAGDGDITLKRLGGSVTGVLFAPKGKVTFVGNSFEGLVIARDGFFVESGGTQVTFKNLDHYIGDPNDYPF